jgi:serine/threonine-protein kinase RsbW
MTGPELPASLEQEGPAADRDPANNRSAPAATVGLQVPAVDVYVSTLRLIAASVATRSELTVDDVEDAVDEACSLLLPHALPGTTLNAEFALSPGFLGVDVSVAAADGAEPDHTGYAWTVLSALAGPVTTRFGDGRLIIALAKRRAPSAP